MGRKAGGGRALAQDRPTYWGRVLVEETWVPARNKMAALKYGSRKFYEIPSDEYSQESHADKSKKDQPDNGLLDYINDNCIGKHTTFSGPFGTRKGDVLSDKLLFYQCYSP